MHRRRRCPGRWRQPFGDGDVDQLVLLVRIVVVGVDRDLVAQFLRPRAAAVSASALKNGLSCDGVMMAISFGPVPVPACTAASNR